MPILEKRNEKEQVIYKCGEMNGGRRNELLRFNEKYTLLTDYFQLREIVESKWNEIIIETQ